MLSQAWWWWASCGAPKAVFQQKHSICRAPTSTQHALLPSTHTTTKKKTHQDKQCGCLHATHVLVAASSPLLPPQLVHCGLPLPSKVQASQSVPQLSHASLSSPNPVSQDVHLVSLAQSKQWAEQRTQAPELTNPQPESQLSLSQRPAPAVSHELQPCAQATQRPADLSSVYPESLRRCKGACKCGAVVACCATAKCSQARVQLHLGAPHVTLSHCSPAGTLANRLRAVGAVRVGAVEAAPADGVGKAPVATLCALVDVPCQEGRSKGQL